MARIEKYDKIVFFAYPFFKTSYKELAHSDLRINGTRYRYDETECLISKDISKCYEEIALCWLNITIIITKMEEDHRFLLIWWPVCVKCTGE